MENLVFKYFQNPIVNYLMKIEADNLIQNGNNHKFVLK